ncbi:hypothetical protein DFP72DRAFT_894858 [Ephemerocybe angulata]|uniref:GST N-terminal domain-containing protein n=1 Tax=Ephemerocybe angulata TaxID=980116 RepID=A0A8H6M8P3_9AGAR|nr:hypothetical protein DFP72DRAFT_894858 [Tulosesus angulatus]
MITLYDYLTELPDKSFSPYAAKVRIVLNYKNLPHRTVFFHPLEIETQIRALNLPPNDLDLKPDGSLRYTIPVLHDEATGEAISDSARIIDYLDRAYPDTPQVTSPSTRVTSFAFESTIQGLLLPHLYLVVGPKAVKLQPGDVRKAYFRSVVEGALGAPIEEWLANPENPQKVWKDVQGGFDVIDGYYRKAEVIAGVGREEEKGVFIGGKGMVYADVALASILVWVWKVLGEESEEWKRLVMWNGGRWGRLHEAIKGYTVVHE